MTRVLTPIRREPALAALVALSTLVYGTYAIVRHHHFLTGFDLAIFDQAIWNLAHLRAPASTVKDVPNLWGDHFHPIIVLLAPLRAIWPSPSALLFGQAALVTASIVPVFLFARDRLGRQGALALSAGYAVFWGLQRGIGYEFHELAFSPLVVALGILWLDRRRWRRFALAMVALALIKEDMAPVVAAFGVVALTLGERRRGLVTIVGGLAWYFVATKLIIPGIRGEPFAYWTYDRFGDDAPSALGYIVTHPWTPFTVAVDEGLKRQTLLALFAPFLFLTLRSRYALVAVPLLAERFLSSNHNLWTTSFHYSLALAPILAMGAAEGMAWLKARRPELGRAAPYASLVANVAAAALVMGIVGAPLFAVVRPDFYAAPSWQGPVSHALEHVPDGASVATFDFQASHLTERRIVAELTRGAGATDFLSVGLVRLVGSDAGNGNFRALSEQVGRRLPGYTPVFYEGGYLVARRGGGDGVLKGMSRGEATRFAPALGAFATGVQTAFRDLGVCPLRGSPAQAAACLGRVGAPLRRVQQQLDARLAALRLRGGCADLAARSRSSNKRFADDIAAASDAGRRQDPRYSALGKRVGVDANRYDLPGLVSRFWLLCGARRLPITKGGIAPG